MIRDILNRLAIWLAHKRGLAVLDAQTYEQALQVARTAGHFMDSARDQPGSRKLRLATERITRDTFDEITRLLEKGARP